jgi:hypothetical protein
MRTLSKYSPLLIIGLLTTLSVPATAQQSGDWVRVETSQAPKRLEGQLLRADADSIVLVRGEYASDTVAVARTAVKVFLVSTGERSNTWRGMGLGFLGGAVVGGLIGVVTFEPCVSDQFLGCMFAPETPSEAAALGGIVGGFGGFVIGTIVGVATKRHRWEPIGVPTSIGIAPAANGGVALSARMTF